MLTTIYVFNLGYILPVDDPLVALALSMVATLGVNGLSAAFEKERVRNEFARFAPDSVVDQVLDEAGDGNKLGGKRRDGDAAVLRPARLHDVLREARAGAGDRDAEPTT